MKELPTVCELTKIYKNYPIKKSQSKLSHYKLVDLIIKFFYQLKKLGLIGQRPTQSLGNFSRKAPQLFIWIAQIWLH